MCEDDMHITRELLCAVASGELAPSVLLNLAARHVSKLCPYCQAEFRAFANDSVAQPPATREELETTIAAVRQQLTEAQAWMRELKRLDPQERLGRVQRARTRFRGRLFARLALYESRAQLPDDPKSSHEWASVALASVFYSAGHDDLRVRAIAYQANALRLLGDVARARDGFAWARKVITQRGVTDLDVYAELDRLQASLLLNLRAFEEAENLLARSAMLYGLLQDSQGSATVLLKLSMLYTYRGDIDLALETDRKVLEVVDLADDPQLYVYARFNLAYDLVEAGDIRSARDLLAYDEDLFDEHADETTRINVRWLSGRIAFATREHETAEGLLCAARDAYAERGDGLNVACICLDLALVYFELGATEKLTEVAGQAVVLFAEQEVHRDALAALILLRDAAQAQTLTVTTIEKVSSYLKEVRTNPSARFEPAN